MTFADEKSGDESQLVRIHHIESYKSKNWDHYKVFKHQYDSNKKVA